MEGEPSPLAQFMNRWMGYGVPLRKESYGAWERAAAFLEVTKPILGLMGPLLAAAGAVLAVNGFPSLAKCILGALWVFIATLGIQTFNDWADRKRDVLAWPGRTIPTGRLKPVEVLAFSLCLLGLALFGTWRTFNPTVFLVLLIALVVGAAYCVVLRDRVGYLSLPPIVAIFPIGGWAAFSPETLFASPLPWLLYLLTFGWQAAHIMIYSAGHPVEEVGGRTRTEVPALFFRSSSRVAAALGCIFLIFTFALSIGLFWLTSLRYVYLVLAGVSGVVVVTIALGLVRDAANRKRAILAFSVASFYEMALFGGILLDMFAYGVVFRYGRIGLSYLSTRPQLVPVVVAVGLSVIAIVLTGLVLAGLGAQLLYSRKSQTTMKQQTERI